MHRKQKSRTKPRLAYCKSCRRQFVPEDRRRSVQECPFCGYVNTPPLKTSDLKKEAWRYFATWIKHRDKGVCVTCGREMLVDSGVYHAGHFLDGRTKGILFDERCVHGQCQRCNIQLGGNKDTYWPWMIEHYGLETIEELVLLQRRAKGSWTKEELIEIIQTYDAKLQSEYGVALAPDERLGAIGQP